MTAYELRISDWSSDVCSSDLGVVLVDCDALGGAEHAERDVFELDPEILGDDFALAQDRDVLEHRLAAIAEARRLDRGDLQTATQQHGRASCRDSVCP